MVRIAEVIHRPNLWILGIVTAQARRFRAESGIYLCTGAVEKSELGLQLRFCHGWLHRA